VIRATHPPRAALRRPPVWELLTAAGVESGVVRFDFTYPADARAGAFVVSNRIGRDTWEVARVRVAEGGNVVWPPAHAAELSAAFGEDVPIDTKLLATILPGGHPPRSEHQKLEQDTLRTAVDIDQRTFDASERLLRLRPNIPFLAVYLGGFDNACHSFWEYRFPEDYGAAPPAADDVAAFGGVVDRYLEFLDRGLARLLAAYSTPPNVVIISDHGHTAILDHPLWRGWHDRQGILIGAGPAFPHDERPMDVSYFDIVPTLADAVGLATPDGMHGTSLIGRR
jgi:predicted AlkP superfamily phosphohydrolase/phosphomutase